MTSIIKVGIAGYGNLGRGAQAAIKQSPDMQLVAIFSRRDPASVTLIDQSVPVYAMDNISLFTDDIDCLLFPSPSPRARQKSLMPSSA